MKESKSKDQNEDSVGTAPLVGGALIAVIGLKLHFNILIRAFGELSFREESGEGLAEDGQVESEADKVDRDESERVLPKKDAHNDEADPEGADEAT